MSPCVLDTTITSLIFNDSPLYESYRPVLDDSTPVLCFQTVAEMRLGALLANWGKRRREALERFLQGFDVIFYSDELATRWAEVMRDARRAGRRLEAGDAWIAATAKYLNAPLLTHNKDFDVEACPSITIHRFTPEHPNA